MCIRTEHEYETNISLSYDVRSSPTTKSTFFDIVIVNRVFTWSGSELSYLQLFFIFLEGVSMHIYRSFHYEC